MTLFYILCNAGQGERTWLTRHFYRTGNNSAHHTVFYFDSYGTCLVIVIVCNDCPRKKPCRRTNSRIRNYRTRIASGVLHGALPFQWKSRRRCNRANVGTGCLLGVGHRTIAAIDTYSDGNDSKGENDEQPMVMVH